ncbi:MAG TPA: GNAT family N-acetyltransferase [Longimicrobium sp.]|nr:GNAT family N-acetyltransferase [Longimicrobium sp.]
MDGRIRPARPDEARALTALAHASKRHWGYPEHWIASWRDALTLTPERIASEPVFVAAEGEDLLGFYALEMQDGACSLEHMWVHPTAIGQGIGGALLAHARATAASLGADTLVIDSDPNAEAFYTRMGATRIGEVPAPVDGIPRVLPRLTLPTRAG